MTHNFDDPIDRRASDSLKWRRYPEDVLPLWVADTDFRAPGAVLTALHRRVGHGVFGYGEVLPEVRQAVLDYLAERYAWRVQPQEIIFLPGVIPGFNMACRAVSAPGDGVLVQTPVYPPILEAAGHAGLVRDEMQLTRQSDGQYGIDFAAFEAAITPRTRIFILCNPHNPVGRVFRRDELERMAEICLRRGVIICADEIHCDLIYGGNRHLPIASLDPEVARRTITLMAPSKTYNIPGLHCALAVVQDADLRARFKAARAGLVPDVNVLGLVAAGAAYRHGQAWLADLLVYLEANRDWLYQAVHSRLPGLRMTRPEGTFLAWIDCREANLPDNPYQFFLEHARVALSDGATFGRGGQGFVRLNFGCRRATLVEAVERMATALRTYAR